jgi:pheromone shutdown protein TraB
MASQSSAGRLSLDIVFEILLLDGLLICATMAAALGASIGQLAAFALGWIAGYRRVQQLLATGLNAGLAHAGDGRTWSSSDVAGAPLVFSRRRR